MIYSILSYFDKDIEKFNPPMIAPMSKEDAIESIIDGCKKGQIENAKCFKAFYFGTFDTVTGKFELIDGGQELFDCAIYVKDK